MRSVKLYVQSHCPPSLRGLITSGLDFTSIQGRPCFYMKPSPQKLHKETKLSWNDIILWINPSWQLHPTHLIHYPSFTGLGERNRDIEARKLIGWNKESLAGKVKVAHTGKTNQGIHSSLPLARELFKTAGLHHL